MLRDAFVFSFPKATLRQAQGDNHSKSTRTFTSTNVTAKLFQTVILVAKEQNDNQTLKPACHPEPGEGLL
jgi:hypothetical protein